MKQVNCLLTFLFLFSLICPSWQVKAQSSGKNLNEEPVVIQNYVGNGDVSNTSQTPAPQNKKLINQVRELSKQLNEARESGNIQLTKELENQINTLCRFETSYSRFWTASYSADRIYNTKRWGRPQNYQQNYSGLYMGNCHYNTKH